MTHEHLVNRDKCKGCGVCVEACPKNVLALSEDVNAKGYFPAKQARPDDCVFCAICATMCPDVAITIREIADQAPTENKGGK